MDDVSSIWADKSLNKEEKMWQFAKAIGVTHSGNDELFIQRMQEMELRDKVCQELVVTRASGQ